MKRGKIDYRRYTLYKIMIAVLLGMIVGAFIVAGNYVIPLVALVIASILMYFLRTRVDAVISDERIEKITGKASRAVYIILVFGMAVSAIALMALKEKNPLYEMLGYALSYIACGSMLAYAALFRYFYNKGAGK